MQSIYILTDQYTEDVVKSISSSLYVNGTIHTDGLVLDERVLIEITKMCPTEYFFVIATRKKLDLENFDFWFKPEEWDNSYVHVWNDDPVIRLFNKSNVLSNPQAYTDKELSEGRIKLKSHPHSSLYPEVSSLMDIIYLSFGEPDADSRFDALKSRFPIIQRVDGVKGILKAHQEAALRARTDMFYVVDADAEILPSFKFNYNVLQDERSIAHVWHSRNPINDLEYGYGGVKLFPRDAVLNYRGRPVDFTTTVTKNIRVIPEVSNITKFNTDPFSTWRSAFRECAKLASKAIHHQNDNETTYRLGVWCTVGIDREFGDFAIMGAVEGKEFGLNAADKPNLLGLINDFSWLERKFQES